MGRYGVCNTLHTVSLTGTSTPGLSAIVTQETPGLGGVPPVDFRISPTYSPKIKRVFNDYL